VSDLGEDRLRSGAGPVEWATTTTPMNIDTSRPTITERVLRALSASGGSNSDTALEMTSIPVIAVAPDENARRISSNPSASVA